ncbi:hypothetical protein ACIKTA_11160, partial [Hansschlegelia beijingensis]
MVREAPCAQDASALTEADRKRITEAVTAAEARTAGEIVVVIETEPCEERDVAVALVIAGFLAIFAAAPLSLLDLRLGSVVIGQAAIFAALAALAAAP